jgi:hypothetical protein
MLSEKTMVPEDLKTMYTRFVHPRPSVSTLYTVQYGTPIAGKILLYLCVQNLDMFVFSFVGVLGGREEAADFKDRPAVNSTIYLVLATCDDSVPSLP